MKRKKEPFSSDQKCRACNFVSYFFFTGYLLPINYIIIKNILLFTELPHYFVMQHGTDPIFLSLDANFRLCRRANAGKSTQDSPLLNQYFLDQQKVDEYIDNCPSTAASSESSVYMINFAECVLYA